VWWESLPRQCERHAPAFKVHSLALLSKLDIVEGLSAFGADWAVVLVEVALYPDPDEYGLSVVVIVELDMSEANGGYQRVEERTGEAEEVV
jgi:hypothetical protein